MDDMDVLRKLIREKALVSVENRHGKNAVKLQQSNDKQQGYAIEISNAPDEIIAIDLDTYFPPPKCIFKGDKGENKRADFVLFATNGDKNWIVYIEMQQGSSKLREEIKKQLKGAQCFVVYCRAVGEIFWGETKFLQKKRWKQRFVSIKNISINKKPTRHNPEKLHDEPEKFLTINAPRRNRLQFHELVNSL